MRALVVDDDFQSRRLIQHLLKVRFDCDVAVDGKEALAAIDASWQDEQPYELLCLDIDMPGMDGHETLKCVRQMEEERKVLPGTGVRVVMITAHSDPKTVFASFRNGCEAFIAKPIAKEKLYAEIAKLGLPI